MSSKDSFDKSRVLNLKIDKTVLLKTWFTPWCSNQKKPGDTPGYTDWHAEYTDMPVWGYRVRVVGAGVMGVVPGKVVQGGVPGMGVRVLALITRYLALFTRYWPYLHGIWAISPLFGLIYRYLG